MTVQDSDKFLVNRSSNSFHVQAKNLMAELQDTDLMLVNRNGQSYKATGADIKDSLGPTGVINQPSIVAPADNAGEMVAAETDEITGFIEGPGRPWDRSAVASTGYVLSNKVKILFVNLLPLSSILIVFAKTLGLFFSFILKLPSFKNAFISVPIISLFFSSI